MLPLVACALLSGSVAAAEAPSAEELAGYERLLRDHGLAASGPDLLKFFRDRTLSKEQIAQLAAKVEKLGSETYGDRVKAGADLVKAGQLAKPLLVQLIKNPKADPEAVRRAELCLRQIVEGNEVSVAVATSHMVAKHKPDGSLAALLDYTPFATDPRTIEAVQYALNGLAGKVESEKLLRDALTDPSASKRGAAGEALVKAAGLKNKPYVEHLLKDPAATVRLQIALALVDRKDKSAVPHVIQAMPDLPREEVWIAEDLLLRLAGESAPGVYLGGKESVAKVSAAWFKWWQGHEATVNLDKLAEAAPMQGYTLVTQMVLGGGLNGRVFELRPNKEVHWKIDGLRYPVDAQVVGKDRVLIAEYLNNRVTERNLKGDVLWEKAISMPIGIQRLTNGHTFIATRRQVLIVDRDGKEVFTHFPQNISIAAAQRLRDGQFVVVTSAGQFQLLNEQGKEVKSFQVGQVYSMGGNIDPLPGGRFLLPLYRENRVVEYDRNGQVVWQAQVQYPTSAVRLPNGNTLVVSLANQRVVELTRDGQTVWTHQCDGRPWRARRR